MQNADWQSSVTGKESVFGTRPGRFGSGPVLTLGLAARLTREVLAEESELKSATCRFAVLWTGSVFSGNSLSSRERDEVDTKLHPVCDKYEATARDGQLSLA